MTWISTDWPDMELPAVSSPDGGQFRTGLLLGFDVLLAAPAATELVVVRRLPL